MTDFTPLTETIGRQQEQISDLQRQLSEMAAEVERLKSRFEKACGELTARETAIMEEREHADRLAEKLTDTGHATRCNCGRCLDIRKILKQHDEMRAAKK